MRVLVCGDRNWVRADLVFWNVQRVFCENYDNDPVLIEGEARGADTHGRLAAEKLGIPVLRFPAKWDIHGKAAGPIRNQQMLTEGKPDLVLAFHNSIETSKGTADMVKRAKKAGIPVEVITVGGPGDSLE